MSIRRIAEAVRAASSEVGGRVLEQGESEFVIRSSGYVENRLDLEQVVVYAEDGTPVTLADIARIVEGPALRRGIVDLDGVGETVAGIVVMRDGENALDVIRRIKAKIEDLERGLPEGVRIVTTYDRAPLIEGAVSYPQSQADRGRDSGGAGDLHLPAACPLGPSWPLITLPLGVLGAFVIMSAQGDYRQYHVAGRHRHRHRHHGGRVDRDGGERQSKALQTGGGRRPRRPPERP